MKVFTLSLRMDNAAFDDPSELNRILHDLMGRVKQEPGAWNVFDANGNKVGTAMVQENEQ